MKESLLKFFKKNIFFVVLLVFCIGLLLTLKPFVYRAMCDHHWSSATCQETMCCVICGKTAGTGAHKTTPATCNNSEVCKICKAEISPALGHRWNEPTFNSPKMCAACYDWEGESLSGQCLEKICFENGGKYIQTDSLQSIVEYCFTDAFCNDCNIKNYTVEVEAVNGTPSYILSVYSSNSAFFKTKDFFSRCFWICYTFGEEFENWGEIKQVVICLDDLFCVPCRVLTDVYISPQHPVKFATSFVTNHANDRVASAYKETFGDTLHDIDNLEAFMEKYRKK